MNESVNDSDVNDDDNDDDDDYYIIKQLNNISKQLTKENHLKSK